MVASDLTGLAALRALSRQDDAPALPPPAQQTPSASDLPPIEALIGELAASGHGVVLVMGKGGVGKTTIAIEVALGLARLGHPVHLSTTDPAGDPAAIVGPRPPPGVTVSRIDPESEVRSYTQRKLKEARGLDPDRLALLEEDLRSPCTQEIAVFIAFSRLLSEAHDRFVVLDTAPTGHTLLLLDTTGTYHRAIMRTSTHAEVQIKTPLMRLQDPAYTRVLIVTLAEATPVQEAAGLQEDLHRAGIDPFGWVVNATLSGSGTHDPLLLRRASLEQRHLQRIREQLATRAWRIPWRVRAVGEAGASSPPSRG